MVLADRTVGGIVEVDVMLRAKGYGDWGPAHKEVVGRICLRLAKEIQSNNPVRLSAIACPEGPEYQTDVDLPLSSVEPWPDQQRRRDEAADRSESEDH